MIKKIAFFLFLYLIAGTVHAQDVVKDFDEQSLDDLLTVMQNPADNEKLLVQVLFSIPEEYHQYTMPMIAGMFGISEKTRMMPGIVEWRRKLPTRIAPQLEEYAKEHLRYLHPALYPYLMPEAWPEVKSSEDIDLEYVPSVFQISSAEDMERVFPSSIASNTLLDKIFSGQAIYTPKQNDNVPKLSQADVEGVLSVMNKLKALENGKQGRQRRNTLVVDYKDMDLLIEAHVNPCQSLISRLHKIEADKWFEKQVARENMSVDEFTQKCDATIKAYRMYLTYPGVTRSVYNLSKEAVTLPPDSYRRRLIMMVIRMFETSKDNVNAVRGKADELRETFHKKHLFLGTPVLLDF